jgi:hypothetical protein
VLLELVVYHTQLLFLPFLQLCPELLALPSTLGVFDVGIHPRDALRKLRDLLDHVVVQILEHNSLL